MEDVSPGHIAEARTRTSFMPTVHVWLSACCSSGCKAGNATSPTVDVGLKEGCTKAK